MQKTEPIVLKICETSYHIANVTLDFKEDNENIYYSPKESITEQIGKDLNFDVIAGRPDHFSFHTDGRVHLKYKSVNRSKGKSAQIPLYHEIGKLPGGLFSTNRSLFTPLIIDSIFMNRDEWPMPRTQSTVTPWTFGDLREISLLLFLMDANTSHAQLLLEEVFRKLDLHEAALRMPFFQGHDVVACVTHHTLPEIFPESLSNFGLHCERTDSHDFSRQLVVGPPPFAFKHLCYKRSIVMPQA